MEARRCSACGAVVLCDCVVCPVCRKPRLRPLSEEELAAWARHEELDDETRAKAVAVQCELVA